MLFSVIAIFLKWVIIKIVLSGCNYSNCNITMHFSGIAIFLNWVKEIVPSQAELHMELWTYNNFKPLERHSTGT